MLLIYIALGVILIAIVDSFESSRDGEPIRTNIVGILRYEFKNAKETGSLSAELRKKKGLARPQWNLRDW